MSSISPKNFKIPKNNLTTRVPFCAAPYFSNRLPTDLDLEQSHWAAITWGI